MGYLANWEGETSFYSISIAKDYRTAVWPLIYGIKCDVTYIYISFHNYLDGLQRKTMTMREKRLNKGS